MNVGKLSQKTNRSGRGNRTKFFGCQNSSFHCDSSTFKHRFPRKIVPFSFDLFSLFLFWGERKKKRLDGHNILRIYILILLSPTNVFQGLIEGRKHTELISSFDRSFLRTTIFRYFIEKISSLRKTGSLGLSCRRFFFIRVSSIQQGLVGSSRDGLTAKLALTSLLNHRQLRDRQTDRQTHTGKPNYER